ncbi:MAG: patatin-like phospholipase family protein [Bacteroidota bacterium]
MHSRTFRSFVSKGLISIFTLISSAISAQTVGLVLSGGGGNALAHVGVIRALEENHIPIDYISGTSMGAIVGGLYAAGYSPDQLEVMLTSPEFLADVQGEISDEFVYFFKQPRPDASIAQVKFSKDKPLATTLPTNLVSPFALDFKMIEVFGGANAVAKENFDSLFVPFRCVASDITNKKIQIFGSGQLNMAIRASATYPFYYKPVMTNDKLLFDGGLYNNFPVDVLIDQFNPDIIIGSNVSYNYEPATTDDLISQIKNMLVSITDYSLRGKPGLIIEPDIQLSAFDFNGISDRISSGYAATIKRIPELKELCARSVTPESLTIKRQIFNAAKPPLVFDELEIKGVNSNQAEYIRNSLLSRKDTLSYAELKPKFLKLFQDDQLKYIYPTVQFNPRSNKYALCLYVEKEKDFSVKFGGNFSSKPINTGFVSFRYNLLGKNSYNFEANSYFGKYYGSVLLRARMQTGWRIPIFVEPFAVLNRFDYFKSKATFFEEVKPSYILLEEKFAGVAIGVPVRYKTRFTADFKTFMQDCNYYLTSAFQAKDTSDLTRFTGWTSGLAIERNTLNRKQWASQGTLLKFSTRYIQGFEKTVPGSTNIASRVNRQFQDWLSFSFEYTNYFKTFKKLTFGFHASAVYNTQYFFSNYQANQIFSPAFQPIPESKTLFLQNFRANKYMSSGISGVVNLGRNFDYRVEAYLFQPVNELQQTTLQLTKLGDFLSKRYSILSTSLLFHSPFGPLSLSLNYYEREVHPVSFVFNFGFILFNRSVME